MVTHAAAASVEVLGLVAVVTAIEPDPLAEFYGHGSFHEVETLHWLTDADEHVTLGQLVARYGLDEGDRITIRCATVAEQTAQLAAVLAQAAPVDPSLHGWDSKPEAVRDADGMLVDPPSDGLGEYDAEREAVRS